MTKFKHGDRVTCTIEYEGAVHDTTDARMSIDDNGTPFICHNNPNYDWSEADDMFGYPYCLRLSSDFTNTYVTNLKLAVKKVRDADVGDEVTSRAYLYKVIDSLPNSVLLSLNLEYATAGDMHSRDELEEHFTFLEPTPTPPPEEMTLEEVCRALGKDIIIKG